MAKAWFAANGLIDKKDFLFTSEVNDNFPLDRRSVSNLFLLTNFFCFPSWSEVSPQALLEAMISPSKPFILATNRVVSIAEHLGNYEQDRMSFFDASFRTPGKSMDEVGNTQKVNYTDKEQYFKNVAFLVQANTDKNHIRRMFSFSWDKIWDDQMKPLLYGE